jgi:hypothetical protein
MAKLCQIIAVEKSVKNKAHNGITEVYQKMQKPALLSGISRSYRPKDEMGEVLPSEKTLVQLNAVNVLKDVATVMSELFDITATKDYANCKAVADVVVGDVTIAKDVPVTYLLFLEKALTNVHTLVSKLPTLDPSEEWTFDPNVNCYTSKPAETIRTKKVPKVFTKAPATDKHPAQVEMIQEDQSVGTWTTVKFSGAMPATRVAEMLERVERLQKAVKFAREEANSREVEQQNIGKKVFNYLFD